MKETRNTHTHTHTHTHTNTHETHTQKRTTVSHRIRKPSTCICEKKPLFSLHHGGDSIDTTCAVVRDVTAYIAVVRVFRFPSEYYGCRYHQCPCFSVHSAKISSLFNAIITENCQEVIYRYFQRVSNFLNI